MTKEISLLTIALVLCLGVSLLGQGMNYRENEVTLEDVGLMPMAFTENRGQGIAADGFGNAYVTGYTWSYDFPYENQMNGWKRKLGFSHSVSCSRHKQKMRMFMKIVAFSLIRSFSQKEVSYALCCSYL